MSNRKYSFEVTKTTNASAATVFRLVTDGGNWAKWAKPIVVTSSWVRQGDPPQVVLEQFASSACGRYSSRRRPSSTSRIVVTSTSWSARQPR